MKVFQPVLLLVGLLVPFICATNKLLIISMDGFRWDYIDKFNTPNFDKLREDGVYAPLGAKAAFTTKTFPNHYTIATGLYEESHGIVNNRMYDPLFKASFNATNKETRWWDGGEPIWITARLQNLKTAVYFWVGSETELKNIHADFYKPYNKSIDFEKRIDTVVKWLKEEKVDLAMAYFSEPDGSGHTGGVFSKAVQEAVTRMDKLLGYTIEKLQKAGLWNKTNLLVVSDHGMTNVTNDKEHIIVLSDYIDMESEVQLVPQDGAVAMILPKEGKRDIIYSKLQKSGRKMKVYKKEDIPEHYHYKNHRRIMPLVLIADEGYLIKQYPLDPSKPLGIGEHGYDNDLPSMKPIFFARGPDFKAKAKLKEFETVNIYELSCHLLKIKCAVNNGSIEVFRGVLKNAGLEVTAMFYLVTIMAIFTLKN